MLIIYNHPSGCRTCYINIKSYLNEADLHKIGRIDIICLLKTVSERAMIAVLAEAKARNCGQRQRGQMGFVENSLVSV